MQKDKRQGHTSDDDSRDALEKPIQTIAVCRDIQFAAQLPKLKNRFKRPLFRNDEDNFNRHENDREQTMHAVNGLDTHIFNILNLIHPKGHRDDVIKAIAMFNASSQPPIVTYPWNGGDMGQRDVGN